MISNSPKREISIIKTNAKIRSLENISFQEGLESLNLSNNLIFDFEGLQKLEKLKTLIMDDNPIISFKGFPEDGTPNIEEVSFVNCPFSKLKNFKSLCVIVMGSQLKKINGNKVTRNDHANAMKYGDLKAIRLLLIFGWIPQRPIVLQKNAIDSIWESLEKRKNDPFSLKAVSILRTIGYSKSEIKNIIRLHFSPDDNYTQNKTKKNSSLMEKDQAPDSIEDQIQKQQELINVLSVQLQALRNGNKSFNAYDEMIKTIGAPLIENAKIIGYMTVKRENKNSNLDSSQSKKFSTSELKGAEDYEELRKAAIDVMQEDEEIDDYDLIKKLKELIPEEDNQDEDNTKTEISLNGEIQDDEINSN